MPMIRSACYVQELGDAGSILLLPYSEFRPPLRCAASCGATSTSLCTAALWQAGTGIVLRLVRRRGLQNEGA